MNYDAIVIGAGPAGSTAAFLLARAGWTVAIVEKSDFPRAKVCGEFISAPALSLLARAGLAQEILTDAGPEIREIAIYAGERVVTGKMPAGAGPIEYGRALGRDRLDTLMLAAAKRAGVEVWQPWSVKNRVRADGVHVCRIERKGSREKKHLAAPVVIAAHGSWDTRGLAHARLARRAAPSDLFAFKARFSGGALDPARMPLVAFPGGYGGLVTSDGGRTSFSCCIRRDVLAACRADAGAVSAGAAVLSHVLGSCRGMRDALDGALREGAWLAAGPLQPGIRTLCDEGYFAVGNAIGEAHPIVAEGISMAIQSAWLLSERLLDEPKSNPSWNAAARDYEAAYRRNFERRIIASSAFAALAVRRSTARSVAALLEHVPGLLSLGARWAGKATPLRAAA